MAEERDNCVTLYGVMSPWPALLYAPRSRAVFDERASLRLILRACRAARSRGCQPLKGCASGLHVPGATEAEYTHGAYHLKMKILSFTKLSLIDIQPYPLFCIKK